ncbi:DUF3098 domain-containing protein [Flavobacterium sp. RHBU_3]|uniref:DUF3098 domain-containing protein n=1 Tax=Flavobacterium sp. RHBU_3 TaxID=3391184 RepID=UPI0039851881
MENNPLKTEFLFEKVNYKILFIGLAVVALGYLLMSGGGSTDPKVFSEDIFNFRRIRLAPTVVLIGYGITIYAILKNPKKGTETFPEDQPIKTKK